MGTARMERHLAGPRRRVRWVYLIAAWPEGKHLDHLDAFEQAPDAAVIDALTYEIDVLAGVMNTERIRADEAVAELEQLRDALATVRKAAGL